MAVAANRPGVLGLLGLATFAVVLEIAPRAGLVPAEYEVDIVVDASGIFRRAAVID